MMFLYGLRNQVLREMGFPTYQDYLGSQLWAHIRWQVLKRDSNTCRKCGERASLVHHRAYTKPVLQGSKAHLIFLISLCHKCHTLAEFDNSRKVSLDRANSRLGLEQGKKYCGGCKKPRRWADFYERDGTTKRTTCTFCAKRASRRTRVILA